MHAIDVFFIHPDPNVEGSEKFQKVAFGYSAMVAAPFALAYAEPYLIQGGIKAFEFGEKGIEEATKFVIKHPKIFSTISKVATLGLGGPEPLNIPGEPNKYRFALSIYGAVNSLYQNEVYKNYYKIDSSNVEVLSIPLYPADKTNIRNTNIPSSEQILEKFRAQKNDNGIKTNNTYYYERRD